jgi:cell wall-associated NlpC family hydrolase
LKEISAVNRLPHGAALALVLTAVLAAPSAAAETGGGTPITGVASEAASTTTAPAPAPAEAPKVSATRAVSLSRSQTRSVQRKVNVRADGKIGAKTRSAIRRYQVRRDLTPTGRPNLETLRKMRLAFASTIERRLATGAHASTPTASSAALSTALAAVQSAIGTPYRSGGTTTSGFDCSGLMVWAFKQAGVTLPRTSFDQYELGTDVDKADIQVGDLVFFSSAGAGASHVGIATSATTVISATNSGVMEHRIDSGYWASYYVGAKRLATA